MPTNLAIVDYGLGNIRSVHRALEKVGARVVVTNDPRKVRSADKLVLPGVGAFQDGMNELIQMGLDDAVRDVIDRERPVLGICLGMQLFFDQSTENGKHAGLGVMGGKVERISNQSKARELIKVPHIGWAQITAHSGGKDRSSTMSGSIVSESYYYFIHSYMVKPNKQENVLAECNYSGIKIVAAVHCNNLFGVQFHPEKSGEEGLKVLRKFQIL